MIGKTEKRNRNWYIVYLAMLLSIFTYANFSGWRIFNTDSVEHYEPGKARSGSRMHIHSGGRFFHK